MDKDAATEPSSNDEVQDEETEEIPTEPQDQMTALDRLMQAVPDWPLVSEPLEVETNKKEVTGSKKKKKKLPAESSGKRKPSEPAGEPPWMKKTKPAEPPRAPPPPPNPLPMSPPKGPAPKTKVTDPGHRAGGMNKAVVLARAYRVGDHQACQRLIEAFPEFFQ